MKRHIGFVIALLLIPFLGDATEARRTAPCAQASTAHRPPAVDRQETPCQAARLEAWGRERFAAAGLQLPEVHLTQHEGREPCQGHPGLARFGGSTPSVDICVGAAHGLTVVRRVVLHELGHVWLHVNLGAAARAGFLGLRDLDTRAEPAPPHRQGCEHAAEILAWGLIDRRLRLDTVTPAECPALVGAFTFLAGTAPISPAAAECAALP